MAKVVKVGDKYAVAHDITGKILVRKGKRVIHPTRALAQADAEATRIRVMGRATIRTIKDKSRSRSKTPISMMPRITRSRSGSIETGRGGRGHIRL